MGDATPALSMPAFAHAAYHPSRRPDSCSALGWVGYLPKPRWRSRNLFMTSPPGQDHVAPASPDQR